MVDESRNYFENIGMDNCDYYSIYILAWYEPKLFVEYVVQDVLNVY